MGSAPARPAEASAVRKYGDFTVGGATGALQGRLIVSPVAMINANTRNVTIAGMIKDNYNIGENPKKGSRDDEN